MTPALTDIELVDAAAATYVAAAEPFARDPLSATRVLLTDRADGLLVFAFEGTENPQGWALDFDATHVWNHPTRKHATLGYIHAGFYLIAAQILSPVVAEIRKTNRPFALSGHSLGAALALLIGGLLIDRGLVPVTIGAFAPPRVGYNKFVRAVSSVPIRAFRYGNDPVPEVPFHIPFFFPYQQVPLVAFGKAADDPFTCHHIQNYVSAVRAART